MHNHLISYYLVECVASYQEQLDTDLHLHLTFILVTCFSPFIRTADVHCMYGMLWNGILYYGMVDVLLSESANFYFHFVSFM